MARKTKINVSKDYFEESATSLNEEFMQLFQNEDEDKNLYEVRTRKILLISNSIASTSTIINSVITNNPKKLDIGSLLNTISHLFSDIRFISKIKEEFIENEISNKLMKEIAEIDGLYYSI